MSHFLLERSNDSRGRLQITDMWIFSLLWLLGVCFTFALIVIYNYRTGRVGSLFLITRLMLTFVLWPLFLFAWIWTSIRWKKRGH
jgi:hypothetical protein